jgi:hypothetical protein
MKNERLTGRYHLKFLLILIITLVGASISLADSMKLIREKSFQVKDWQNLYTKASGADVKVESWDKQEVYVKIFANHRAEEKMRFDIYQDGDVVKVIAEKKGNSFWNLWGGGISVRIEAFVPRNFNAHLESSGGDLSVANLTGGFKLYTSGGDVNTNNTDGKLHAETSGGDIKLNSHKGEMDISTSGGDIICHNVKGDVKGETSGGDIHIEVTDGKIDVSTSGGDIGIDYSGANQGIEASTSGGSITAKLPSDFKAKAHLETSGGDIDNNFSNSKSTHVKRSRVDAEFNGGGPTLNLETSGGDVEVNQK